MKRTCTGYVEQIAYDFRTVSFMVLPPVSNQIQLEKLHYCSYIGILKLQHTLIILICDVYCTFLKGSKALKILLGYHVFPSDNDCVMSAEGN